MNSFGNAFRISIFGASHAPKVGVTIEGVPAGIALAPADFLQDIMRRKSGALGTTSRIEEDIPTLQCRLDQGYTTGDPVTIYFENKNIRPEDYDQFKTVPRPGHADYTAAIKYFSLKKGFDNRDFMGGGFFSGRMTLPLVAAGVVAKKVISPIQVRARILEIGGIPAEKWEKIEQLLELTAQEGDSLGGVIECYCDNVPAGLGEPFFDSFESAISHAVFSIPGIRGIEFGDGFACSKMKGSQHNDCFIDAQGHTAKNGCGGINGGLTNGNQIVFRVAVKPTSSIVKEQETWDFANNCMTKLSAGGRHDVCFALRVPPVIEAVTACVLADFNSLSQQALK